MWLEPVQTDYTFYRSIVSYRQDLSSIQVPPKHNHTKARLERSDLPNLKQEFSSVAHDRGTLSMARSSDPDSANSQFFICFKAAPFLDRQYTVFGKVLEGMEFVDKIKRGDDNNNGSVSDPDKIISFKSQ